jgi:hypothetical protein
MEEAKIPESWQDLKKTREERGISLSSLSEKMRLPVEKIEFIEKGDFEHADPVITKLQLKNYAFHLGLDYHSILELSGLKEPSSQSVPVPLGEKIKIKKTRSYRGRKKEPSKILIYIIIVAGVVGAIFLLNFIASNLNIASDVFEMTENQKNALDVHSGSSDSAAFKPVIPQAVKEEIKTDIIENMNEYQRMSVSFPLKIDIFPKETLSYRHESPGMNPKEDFIMKEMPTSLFYDRPGRVIFYNAQNSRFVISGFAFRETDISRVAVVIDENRELTIFTK